MRKTEFREFLETYYEREANEVAKGVRRAILTKGEAEFDSTTALYIDIGFLKSFDPQLAEWTVNNPIEASEEIITASQSIRQVPEKFVTVRFTGVSEERPVDDLPEDKLVATKATVNNLGQTVFEQHTIEGVCECDTPFEMTRGRGDRRPITCRECFTEIPYRKPDRIQRTRSFRFGPLVGAVYREHTEDIEEREYRVTGIVQDGKIHVHTFSTP